MGIEQWGMGRESIDLLYKEWQALVRECASALHAARLSGVSESDLQAEMRCYALRIDAVYERLKRAEARDLPRFARAASI
ncbi:MAG: hypothetical protein JOY62_12280 [Acidobacteriaceae bacterium]|nr:hypothetical protein [Acidobacteriaceae bacterium]MBV9780736.1 hypothetical protein [Acidobacteriaceae bacterium]